MSGKWSYKTGFKIKAEPILTVKERKRMTKAVGHLYLEEKANGELTKRQRELKARLGL